MSAPKLPLTAVIKMTVPRFVIWCPVCDQIASDSPADWERYERVGWPQCCGRQMACYTPTPPAVDMTHAWDSVRQVDRDSAMLAG